MALNRGDIVFLPFPNSDLRTFKRRPALVVQADNLETGIEQIVVAMISSNPGRAGHRSRVAVSPAAGSGLLVNSWVMTDNLTTVRLKLCQLRGRLLNMAAVDAALRATLALPSGSLGR
jgi:mRNA interferase MazF